MDYDNIMIKAFAAQSSANTVYHKFEFKLVHWNALDTDKKRCDDDERTEANTTKCLTSYFETQTGCSMGMAHSNPDVQL